MKHESVANHTTSQMTDSKHGLEQLLCFWNVLFFLFNTVYQHQGICVTVVSRFICFECYSEDQGWKSKLKLPPKDNRVQTTVSVDYIGV